MKKTRILVIAMAVLMVFAAVSCEEEPVVKTDAYVGTESELKSAIAEGIPNIHLSADIDVTETIVITDKSITLDLNGKTLSNSSVLWDKPSEEANNWSLVSIRGTGNLVITGEGELKALENDCYAVDVQDKDSKLTIENGTFVGNVHAVYVHEGAAYINGGKYSIQQKFSSSQPDEFVLNCYDPNYQGHDIVSGENIREYTGPAKIVVTGGTFANFNPSDCAAEGKGTNFLAKGYKITSKVDGRITWWTVEKE